MERVRLQADDLERLQAAQQVLLSPLSYEDPVEWQLQANRAVGRLIRAEHSVFSLPSSSQLTLITDDTDPQLPARFLTYFAGVIAGEYRFSDPVLQSAERRRRAVGGGAFHERALGSRKEIRRSVAIQEVFRPAGMNVMIGLSTPEAVGEATQFFGFEGSGAEQRSEQALDLLQMVLPAFEAGVRTRRIWIARGAAFATTLDQIGKSAMIFSMAGASLHETNTLRELLSHEPEADRLRAEARTLAGALSAHVGEGDVMVPHLEPRRHVRGRAGVYQLTGSYLHPAMLGVEAVLVMVEPVRTPFPSQAELTSRFHLTPREAEVALLLAHGLTDAAVAARLGVSSHTARRYTERVLAKLNVHSRAAVAVTLLGVR